MQRRIVLTLIVVAAIVALSGCVVEFAPARGTYYWYVR